jgi:hypothetical protein
MTWRGDAGEVAREVVVLDVSGGGAALLAEDAPPTGQSLRLSLHCDSAAIGPIDGRVVQTRSDPSGRRVVHVQFARWTPLEWLVEKHRDRRHCGRHPAREALGELSWLEGPTERTIRGALLNISAGGAAFVSDQVPPAGARIFLRLIADARDGSRPPAIESLLVQVSLGASAMRVAHIKFIDPCPMSLFEMAVDGSG